MSDFFAPYQDIKPQLVIKRPEHSTLIYVYCKQKNVFWLEFETNLRLMKYFDKRDEMVTKISDPMDLNQVFQINNNELFMQENINYVLNPTSGLQSYLNHCSAIKKFIFVNLIVEVSFMYLQHLMMKTNKDLKFEMIYSVGCFHILLLIFGLLTLRSHHRFQHTIFQDLMLLDMFLMIVLGAMMEYKLLLITLIVRFILYGLDTYLSVQYLNDLLKNMGSLQNGKD